MTTRITPKDATVSLMLWLSFLCASGFYGVGANLVMLLASCALLLLALAVLGPRRLLDVYSGRDWSGWVAVWILAVLTCSYLFFTISPESSFAASWVFACIPLWFLAYRALRVRRWAQLALFGTVSIFAVISVVRFLFEGQQAYEPLMDPNTYASLLYLAWIPFAHHTLQLGWKRPDGSRAAEVGRYALCAVLALAVFATSSRIGAFAVAAALLGWLVLVVRRRLDAKPWVLLVLTTAAAFAATLASSDQLEGKLDPVVMSTGMEIRGAMNTAAWHMFLEQPLVGTGVFTFGLRYPLYRLAGDQSTAGMFAHNDYLQLAVETGPWLLIALVLLAVAVARRLFGILSDRSAPDLDRYGYLMAAAALLVHALVNFTLYVLPVGILFAVVCAEALAREPGARPSRAPVEGPEDLPAAPTVGVVAWFAGAALALVAFSQLALDTTTQVVFGGQPGPASLREIRRDPDALLRYARFARGVNPTRATPVLGEALALGALARREPGNELLKEEALHLHREALRLDPYNAFAYGQFYEFLKNARDPALIAELTPDEMPEKLLLNAVRLDVTGDQYVFELLRIYDAMNLSSRGLMLLKTSVFPWLEQIRWQNPPAATRLIEEMRQRALAAGDDAFAATVQARAEEISRIHPSRQEPLWLRDWQERALNG